MADEIKFESAMAQLEEIVKKLESGELSLEESLSAFEEGIKLSKICAKILNDAERRVEILMKNEDGQLIPRSYDEDITGKE